MNRRRELEQRRAALDFEARRELDEDRDNTMDALDAVNRELAKLDLETALHVASIAHSGQKYGSEPYFERHVMDVVARTQAATDDVAAHVVAALHDVVEDTALTLDDIGFVGTRILRAVDAITRRDGETYPDYIERVLADDLAALVKRADLTANLAANPSPDQAARYRAALKQMTPLDPDADIDGQPTRGILSDDGEVIDY